ncbi:MAG: ATP-dependent Clp protease proteolytic subunit [Sphaerochaetaceae bacterium]
MAEEKKNEIIANDDRFLKTRSIMLCGEINEEASEKFVRQLLVLENENDKPIYVFIDSPGGDVNAGYAIFDMIRFVNNEVFLIGMGLVASAAALVLLSGDKEHRFGLPNSSYLIHQPLSKMKGVASDIEIHAKQLEETRNRINREISCQTGNSFEKVEKDTDRDNWMDAEAAIEYGLISKIVKDRSGL